MKSRGKNFELKNLLKLKESQPRISTKQDIIRVIKHNVDGNYLLSGGGDKSVKLWNSNDGYLVKSYVGHSSDVLGVDSSCDNSCITTCSTDRSIILWDVITGKIMRKYREHAGPVNDVKFCEEGTMLISCSVDGTVKLWDCKGRHSKAIQTLNEAKDSVSSVSVSNSEICTCCLDGSIRIYDIRNGRLLTDFIGGSLTFVRFTRDCRCLLVSTLNSVTLLYDKDNGTLLNKYGSHMSETYKIECCTGLKDKTLFCGSEDGRILCYDLVEACVIGEFTCGSPVSTLSHHPTKDLLVFANLNELVSLEFSYA